ncbi:MAG: MGMT family protein [Candidatus Woesearchaeota archaeon]|nr:MAG: MGMT family protein [Candidatus Woesearchaeota archaeon]
MKTEYKQVYQLLKKIPKGKVSTYKEISKVTGIHPRAVGVILNKNKDPKTFPCYRIVKSDGSLGGYALGLKKKIELLKKDGIEIKNKKINLKKYLHNFNNFF